MTTEQLNVIITAQTEDFQTKIAAVNASILETISLAEQSASAVAGITVQTSDSGGKTAQVRASAAENIKGAAANVLSLRSGQTLIGAVTENNSSDGFSKPVEIHTTVELDGEKVGESVSRYTSSRTRVKNGF